MNFQEKINHNQNFSEFSETDPINVRNVASLFQDTIHFHPGHLQPMTLSFYYYSTCGIILNKSRPLFLGFHCYEYVFGFFKVTLIAVTEPLEEGTRVFSVLFPMASIFFRKLLKTVRFDCEMALFWLNLLKAVCFGQHGFF